LVRGIERVLARNQTNQSILTGVAGQLRKLVSKKGAIDPSLIRTDPNRYTRTRLYRDPAGRFVVLLLAWSPHQASPIHDHECWGAVGVAQGVLAETSYVKLEQGGLVPRGRKLSRRGDVSTVSPPDRDIHRMENPSDAVTLTVHVYGRDMTSANVYDEKTGTISRPPILIDFSACDQNGAGQTGWPQTKPDPRT
jgi:predicted metal-dependent enzyme (double-stranded beta helix superfamily)